MSLSLFVTVQVFVSPSAIEPLQSRRERAGVARPGWTRATLYEPGRIETCVPGASAPAKLAGLGAVPVTESVKSAAALEPASSLTTCLITISFAEMSSFVIVQVFCTPATTVTAPFAAQSPLIPVWA